MSEAEKRLSPFGRRDTRIEKEVPVGLPSFLLPRVEPRTPVQAIDLTGVPPTWLLIGQGRAGKTTFARWVIDRAIAAGRDPALAAVDPAQRSLACFFDAVAQPDSPDPIQAARWLRAALASIMEVPSPTLVDMGGGDLSLMALLADHPDLAEAMEAAGAPIVAAYFFGTRVDDLAALASYEARGFRPRATLLVLNESLTELNEDPEEAFAAVKRHSAFRAAVARGAVAISMPRLIPASLVREIERKRLLFSHARDGIAPEGSGVSPITSLDRSLVRRWLAQMEDAFAPIASWLP
jgi:hypothetical protein